MDRYAAQHRNRLNLLVHLLMVPQFVIACAGLLIAIAVAHAELAKLWASIALLSFLGQYVGHLFEEHHDEPVRGFADGVFRWFTEQFYVFPKFVLSGHWWRSFRDQ
ncbi:MAG TPA: Mpo1-like protein [Steroidobacteraceae bacterium]|nr:Mpo1-like protein [Steroidobacteraceae bacterium]